MIAVLPSHCCAWGLNTWKRATMSGRHRSWRKRWRPPAGSGTSQTSLAPSTTSRRWSARGATTSGQRVWAWRSMALSREMEDKWQLAAVVGWVGLLAVWSGDEHDLAEGFLKEAVALDRELGNRAYGAYCLESFAGLAGARAQGARAARLWGAAEALRTNIGAPLPLDGRLLYEPSMAAARPTRRGGVGSGIRAGNGYVGGRSRRVCPGRRRPCLIVTSAGDGAESVANTPEPRSSRAFVK